MDKPVTHNQHPDIPPKITFTIIGIDDNDQQELSEQARKAIAGGLVFSGGKRHHEIMRK